MKEVDFTVKVDGLQGRHRNSASAAVYGSDRDRTRIIPLAGSRQHP